jgi:hypothetical protein
MAAVGFVRLGGNVVAGIVTHAPALPAPPLSDVPAAADREALVRHSASPSSEGPAPHAEHLAFRGAAHGLLVTANGSRGDDVVPRSPGVIQETTDTGATWVTRWSDEQVALTSVAWPSAGTVIALGTRAEPAVERDRPVVVTSRDGGATWTECPAMIPAEAASTGGSSRAVS